MRRYVFVYGTLEIPELAGALLGRIPRGEPARLPGYQRGMVRSRAYPGIRQRAGAETPGRVYAEVSLRELRLLDRFEGDLYARRSVRVRTASGRLLRAQAYVLKPRHSHRLTGRPWDLRRFGARHLAEYVAHGKAVRRGFRGGVR